MDVAVLNDARRDLALRLARMGMINMVGFPEEPAAAVEEWLLRAERDWGLTVIEANLEFYVERASLPQNGAGIGVAIEFYILSLWEWQRFGVGARPADLEGGPAAQVVPVYAPYSASPEPAVGSPCPRHSP